MTSDIEFAKLLHDLRNQLNNISMNAELAKMEIAAVTGPANLDSTTSAIECVDTILDACTNCGALADQLAAGASATDAES